MYDVKRTKSEYGGFLPLELNPGKELFAKYEDNLLRFNSVKAALDHLIKQIDVGKMYIPYYYCPSMIEAIKGTGMEVLFYHIDSDLMPVDLPDEKGSIVLLVDYFGVKGKKLNELVETIENAEVVIDRARL